MAYQGNIELINGIIQKNSGEFPLVDSSAVRVDDSTRLDEYMLAFLSVLINHVDSFSTNVANINSQLESIKNDVAYIKSNLGNISGGSGGCGGQEDTGGSDDSESTIQGSFNDEQLVLAATGSSTIIYQDETLAISNSSTAFDSSSDTLVI